MGEGGGPNNPPVAGDDFYDLLHDTILEEYSPGVMWNDSDEDEDELSTSLLTGPSYAQSFTFGSDGSFTYEPQALWTGSDSFTYEVSDGQDTDEATVYIEVWNSAPVAGADFYETLHYCTVRAPVPKPSRASLAGHLSK